MFRSCVAPHFATRSSRNADEKSCPCHAQRQPLDIARGARLWRRRSVAALIRHIINRHVVRAAARGRHGTWTTEIASAAYSSTYLAPSPCQPLGAGQNDGLVERHRSIIYYLVLSPPLVDTGQVTVDCHENAFPAHSNGNSVVSNLSFFGVRKEGR